MTPDEVLQARFPSTKFRDGYDQDEVDDYLDRVVEVLRARQEGHTSTVAAETLANPRFTATKFREGYDMQAVDDLIARLQADLAGAAPHGSASPASSVPAPTLPSAGSPPGPTGPSDEPVPGLIAPRRSWWRRRP